MKKPVRILVVEDEEAIRTGLIDVLVYHGYEADSASSGTEGLRLALGGTYELVLLDIMLPGMDGYAVCNAIRDVDRGIAIIMLTAKTSDDEIIAGLKLGADDYVGKPFSVQQLMLRIEAVLRRSTIATAAVTTLELGPVTVDLDNLCGNNGSEAIAFTRREIDILGYLAQHPERPVSREELLLKVWGYARNLDIETRTVDIHVAKLRRKIELDPKNPACLLTIRGAGYRLMVGA
jgi:two-component system response regulator RegX3